jgi:hypothetical protein
VRNSLERKILSIAYLRGALLALLAAATTCQAATEASLTAEQIVEKNVAARGGLEAWRKIETLAWLGRIETPNVPGGSMPFILEYARPNKTRFAVDPQGQPGMRIFDGEKGWAVHPARDGSMNIQPYTSEERKSALDAAGLDGPLIDCHAKGIAIALDGIEAIDGRLTYRLKVTLPSGSSQHVWIDADTFLELRTDRVAFDRQGHAATVWMTYSNYQDVQGLRIPMTIERGGAALAATDRMVIDRVVLNPAIDARTFDKPNVPKPRRKVVVDTRTPPGNAQSGAGPAATGVR